MNFLIECLRQLTKVNCLEIFMFPEIQLSTLLLMRILSIRDAVVSVILAGKIIWGIKLFDKRFSRNLLTPAGCWDV